MVFLSRLLSVMPRACIKPYTYEEICRGKDAIRDLLPLTIMNIKKSHRRKPGPGFKLTYRSILFGRSLRLRVTLGTQRAIRDAGGFDRYIYYTPEERFKSTLAVILQRRMKELVAKHPHVKPPPFVKRRPKPIPKNLAKGLEPVEVCDLNKYVYLG